MKRILALFILIFICFSCFGCGYAAQESNPDRSDASSELSEEESESGNSTLDIEAAQKTYKFLISPYTISSKKETFGTIYECEYFFINGVVEGIQATTTLPDVDQAEAFYESVAKTDPHACVIGNVVTYFAFSDGLYYDGYTPEKLYFALDNAGYEVVINFDLNLFNTIFGKETKD